MVVAPERPAHAADEDVVPVVSPKELMVLVGVLVDRVDLGASWNLDLDPHISASHHVENAKDALKHLLVGLLFVLHHFFFFPFAQESPNAQVLFVRLFLRLGGGGIFGLERFVLENDGLLVVVLVDAVGDVGGHTGTGGRVDSPHEVVVAFLGLRDRLHFLKVLGSLLFLDFNVTQIRRA